MSDIETILRVSARPDANLIFALECLLFECQDGIPSEASKTVVRLHYIEAVLRHFDVTPKDTCGYRPDRPPFTKYRPD